MAVKRHFETQQEARHAGSDAYKVRGEGGKENRWKKERLKRREGLNSPENGKERRQRVMLECDTERKQVIG